MADHPNTEELRSAKEKSGNQRFGLLAIFILSGFAGLIYQSIWSHYLGLFLGHAAYAQALVLAIFMGGMAAGAAWISKAGQRWRNLIRGYALIELVIGILGLLFHWIFSGITKFSYEWLIPTLGEPWLINVARWCVAALLILPQTILLGMTFPLMSGGLIRRFPGSDGSLLGGLYFTNSIGAAIGALVAVFVLLPWVGLPGAMTAAGILNLLVAALAWHLAREPEPVTPSASTIRPEPEQRLAHNPLLRMVLFGTALSGAASFAYEIIWIRMLSMAVGSTMHAFELMLASFIAGIAFGGLWVRKRADTTNSPLRLVGWMQVFMGVAALASLLVYANAFAWVGWLIRALAKTDGGYALFNLGTAAVSITVMLPAAFFAGTTLPLFTVTLLRAGHGERSIGRVYAWNTLGSIAGVFLAIHLLIPVLGLKLALCIAALMDLGLGLLLLRLQAQDRRSMQGFAAAGILVALSLIVAVRIPFDPAKVASGVFRYGQSLVTPKHQVAFYRDGKTASIAVMHDGEKASISTNGKVDAGLALAEHLPPAADESTMALLAALPLAISTHPQDIAIIGFGSGMTTHTLLGDSRVARVDTIEIEPVMVQGARLFEKRFGRSFKDARSNIIIDDAKAYFAGHQKQYDAIISEPSNPWISGVGALFSQEFYAFIPRHLKDDGLFVQWVQLYEINDALVANILAALAGNFSDFGIWIANSSDIIIVAKKQGQISNGNMDEVLRSTAIKNELNRLHLQSQQRLDFHKMADARLGRAIAGLYAQGRVNSDYYPVLSLQAPKERYLQTTAEKILTIGSQMPFFLEALGIRQPLPAQLLARDSHLPHDNFSLHAALLFAALQGSSNLLERSESEVYLSSSWSTVQQLRGLFDEDACSKPWSRARIRELASSLSRIGSMIGMVPPEAGKGIFSRLEARCKTLPDEFQPIFRLLEAMVERDYAAMQKTAEHWFAQAEQPMALQRNFSDMMFSALLLSAAHDQRWLDILKAEKEHGNKVGSVGNWKIQRDLLNFMAQNQPPATDK